MIFKTEKFCTTLLFATLCITAMSSTMAQQHIAEIDRKKRIRKAALMTACVSGTLLAQQLFIQIPRWIERPFDRHRTSELIVAGTKTVGSAGVFIIACLVAIKPQFCMTELAQEAQIDTSESKV